MAASPGGFCRRPDRSRFAHAVPTTGARQGVKEVAGTTE
jgi:hypothetical protein